MWNLFNSAAAVRTDRELASLSRKTVLYYSGQTTPYTPETLRSVRRAPMRWILIIRVIRNYSEHSRTTWALNNYCRFLLEQGRFVPALDGGNSHSEQASSLAFGEQFSLSASHSRHRIKYDRPYRRPRLEQHPSKTPNPPSINVTPKPPSRSRCITPRFLSSGW